MWGSGERKHPRTHAYGESPPQGVAGCKWQMQLRSDKPMAADSKDGGHELKIRDGDWFAEDEVCVCVDEPTTWCVDTRQQHTSSQRLRKSRGKCVYSGRQSGVQCTLANRGGRFPASLSATTFSAQDWVVERRHPSRLLPATSLEDESSLGYGDWAQEVQWVVNCRNTMENSTLGSGSLQRGAVRCRYGECAADSMPAKSEKLEAGAFISVLSRNLLKKRLTVELQL